MDQKTSENLVHGLLEFSSVIHNLDEGERFIAGITGGTCSGKDSLAALVRLVAPRRTVVISGDGYFTGPIGEDYDSPTSYNLGLFAFNLRELREGKKVVIPNYNPRTHEYGEPITIEPHDITLVQGMHVLHDTIRDVLDYSAFVEAPLEVMRQRRFARDGEFESEEAIAAKLVFAERHFERYVGPSKRFADLIVINDTSL